MKYNIGNLLYLIDDRKYKDYGIIVGVDIINKSYKIYWSNKVKAQWNTQWWVENENYVEFMA